MKLWLLRPIYYGELRHLDCPYGAFVNAETATDARKLISENAAGNEGAAVWLDASLTSCMLLPAVR